MLCVIPFCAKDVERALDLLLWCSQRGKVNHPCLLVADPDVSWTDGVRAMDLARASFASVECISLESHVEGWIPGSVALFKSAAEYAAGQPFFWLEPDAVPMRATWLDEIERAYAECGKLFMGAFVTHKNPAFPNPYMEGVGVYPKNCWELLAPIYNANVSWTRWGSAVSVPNGINTPLIHHLWGETENPPTFSHKNIPGTNVFSLAQIPATCAVFHRAKDGSLIRLLRERSGIIQSASRLLVVFPFCEKDASGFVRTVKWMAELNPKYPNDALLSWELTTSPGSVKLMKDAVSACFRNVYSTAYPSPKNGEWPPSTAFRHAAQYAQRFNQPWLWLEYDAIPLKPEWLEVMEAEYFRMGKPFMAPQVPGMGHYNGTGIYPPDTPSLLADAFTHTRIAWDMAAKAEMTGKTHDCYHILQHAWGVHQGRLHPFLGNAPMFRNTSLLSQIIPTAVMFHRCKDSSLIDRLRERRR